MYFYTYCNAFIYYIYIYIYMYNFCMFFVTKLYMVRLGSAFYHLCYEIETCCGLQCDSRRLLAFED